MGATLNGVNVRESNLGADLDDTKAAFPSAQRAPRRAAALCLAPNNKDALCFSTATGEINCAARARAALEVALHSRSRSRITEQGILRALQPPTTASLGHSCDQRSPTCQLVSNCDIGRKLPCLEPLNHTRLIFLGGEPNYRSCLLLRR